MNDKKRTLLKSKGSNATPWVVKPLTPAEVYTDRTKFLDYFYTAALNAATRRTMSTVLLGQRRMGKTEIFKRVVNRLFFEQDPRDPHAIVPVYYSFPDKQMDETKFAKEYLENLMRWYIGFHTSQPQLIIKSPEDDALLCLIEESRSLYPFTEMLDLLLSKYETVVKGTHFPAKTALWTPRQISDIDDSTIVVFLDEFQNTRLPQYDFDIVGWMQEAVESPTCPHFVTGSAMSILAREIIGRGALFGRFRSKVIEPLTGYYGAELALKVARYYEAQVPRVIAPVIAERCGGNPFYITAVVQQAAEQKKPITDEETLNELLAVDISSGFIWGELHDQVSRWIERLNEYGITKWILYLSALEEGDRLDIERIQQELETREGTRVPLDTIRDVLVKLSRGDLLEYLELGGWFRKVKDPILLEFLKVWGRIEVEGQNRERVSDELRERYQKLKRRFDEYKGYLAEVFMAQVLWAAQDEVLPGKFFNREEDVQVPWLFSFVRHRVRRGAGAGQEIDVLGAAGGEIWVCQSKWWERSVGIKELEDLMSQGEAVREERDPLVLQLWLFANSGLTPEAEDYAAERGILWSARDEFDELLARVGLRQLPQL
ncbi:MAG: hypothetical protein U9R15_14740 [Chloroflexota bacterium]|nr:hypothetical protein [Chloroflexota bacterium]